MGEAVKPHAMLNDASNLANHLADKSMWGRITWFCERQASTVFGERRDRSVLSSTWGGNCIFVHFSFCVVMKIKP